MSARREDVNLLTWLRRLQAEVDRLKRGDKAVRQNTLRLGNLLLQPDEANHRLIVQDLSSPSSQTKYLPDTDQSWSWPDALDNLETSTVYFSPIYVVRRECLPVEIVLTVQVASDIDHEIIVYRKTPTDEVISQTINFTAGSTFEVITADIGNCRVADRLYVSVEIDSTPDTPAENLAVTVRFNG